MRIGRDGSRHVGGVHLMQEEGLEMGMRAPGGMNQYQLMVIELQVVNAERPTS